MQYLKLIFLIILVYGCVYAVISRICKCLEHHTDAKYGSKVDIDWIKNHPPVTATENNKSKEDENFYV